MRGAGLDAVLYGASAAFALYLLTSSSFMTHRTWAQFASPVYEVAAAASLVLAGAAARVGRHRLAQARLLVALFVLAGALVAPLTAAVWWRVQRGPAYAASEVIITEGAAAEVVHGRDPYATHFASHELAGRTPSIAEHFPYLPGMAIFGLPRAFAPVTPWTDARVFFGLTAALAAGAALARWRTPAERRLRALQVLLVLPTGASLLVAGGDDVPVLALSLLALVLFDRGRHRESAVAIGSAALLKLTAWPLLLALAFAARGPRGRNRIRSPLVIASAIVLAAMSAAAAVDPGSFANDVLLFPLGLTSLPSPAATTTLGSTVVGAVGNSGAPRVLVTAALLVVALLAAATLLGALARSRGRLRAAEPAAAAAAILAVLIVLAPVARAGYWIYPAELLMWAALLRPRGAASWAAVPWRRLSFSTVPRAGESASW